MILSVRDISKTFVEETILDGVSFDLRAGDHVAIVGPNGAGKSTLLKILTDELAADAGSIDTAPRISIGYVKQHAEFDEESTVWNEACRAAGELTELIRQSESIADQMATTTDEQENQRLLDQYDRLQAVLQQKDAYQWENKVRRVLGGMGFVDSMHDMQVNKLSGGQRNRLLLACVLIGQPDLLILDEPSNHLDIETTEWLEQTLAKYPAALLLVSHDRYFLDSIATSVFELVNGTVEIYKGNYSAYVKQKSERLEVQRRTYDKQQAEIEKLEDFIRKHGVGQKATQAEDRRKKLQRIERVELPREIAMPRFAFPPASRTGDIVLRADALAKSYGDLDLFKNLGFQVQRGERWAVVGSNGTGKSTLVKCLLGQEKLDAGVVQLGSGVKIGYFDQLLSQLDLELTPAEAIRVSHKETVDLERLNTLAKFGITGDLALKPLKALSGGERNRTLLALLSELDSNVLVLDEPTNHLDLWSREALEMAIQAFDGTVLLVSHDRYLVNAIADHVLVMRDGRCSVVQGNYDTYRHLQSEGLAIDQRGTGWIDNNKSQPASDKQEKAKSSEHQSNANSAKPKRKRKFPYRKTDEIESDIAVCENRVEEIHSEMLLPEALRDGERIKALQNELSDTQAKIAQLYEHYEEALDMNG